MALYIPELSEQAQTPSGSHALLDCQLTAMKFIVPYIRDGRRDPRQVHPSPKFRRGFSHSTSLTSMASFNNIRGLAAYCSVFTMTLIA